MKKAKSLTINRTEWEKMRQLRLKAQIKEKYEELLEITDNFNESLF